MLAAQQTRRSYTAVTQPAEMREHPQTQLSGCGSPVHLETSPRVNAFPVSVAAASV